MCVNQSVQRLFRVEIVKRFDTGYEANPVLKHCVSNPDSTELVGAPTSSSCSCLALPVANFLGLPQRKFKPGRLLVYVL